MNDMKNKIKKLDLEKRSNKILGVGLPKTGTTSLKAALEILGYRTVHSPRQYTFSQCLGIPMYSWEEVVSTIFKDEKLLKEVPQIGNLKKDLKFSDWDAMVNFGEHTYPVLDKQFPYSKFILTVRDREAWLRSTCCLLKMWETNFKDGKINGFIPLIRKMHIYQYVNYDGDYFNIL